MAKVTNELEKNNPDIAWNSVFAGFGIAVLGTLLVGGYGLFFADMGVWWLANWGLVFLFIGGLTAGLRAQTAEPINGAFITTLFFALTIAAIFVTEFLGIMPDPMPGLPRGDSTFFFVWPLEQLVAATLGAVVGGWLATKRKRKT